MINERFMTTLHPSFTVIKEHNEFTIIHYPIYWVPSFSLIGFQVYVSVYEDEEGIINMSSRVCAQCKSYCRLISLWCCCSLSILNSNGQRIDFSCISSFLFIATNRVRSAPGSLANDLFEQHQGTHILQVIATSFFSINGKNNESEFSSQLELWVNK